MNTILRRSVLGVAGLALSTGVVAGPLATFTDTTPTPGRRRAGREAGHGHVDSAWHSGRAVAYQPG